MIKKFKSIAKRLALLCTIGLLSSCGSSDNTGEAAEFNIGNDIQFSSIATFGSDVLSGQTINVPEAVTLLRLALMNGGSGGQNVKMALYKADGTAGAPGNLIAETASTLIPAYGPLEIPVLTEVALPPGDYVIMAVLEESTGIGNNAIATQITFYRTLTFSDPLPDPFGPTIEFNNLGDFNYYIVVSNS